MVLPGSSYIRPVRFFFSVEATKSNFFLCNTYLRNPFFSIAGGIVEIDPFKSSCVIAVYPSIASVLVLCAEPEICNTVIQLVAINMINNKG